MLPFRSLKQRVRAVPAGLAAASDFPGTYVPGYLNSAPSGLECCFLFPLVSSGSSSHPPNRAQMHTGLATARLEQAAEKSWRAVSAAPPPKRLNLLRPDAAPK